MTNEQFPSTKATLPLSVLHRRKQAGVSLPLLAIFLGVTALVLYFAVVYGPRYFTKAKVQNELSALADFKSNLVSYGSKVGLFNATNASLVALVNQNFFPQSMVSGTAAAPIVTNQWGGNDSVALGTLVTAGDSLNFTKTGIPATACTEFGTAIDNVASVVTINGTSTKAAGAITNPATVGTSCGGAAGDDNVFVITIAK